MKTGSTISRALSRSRPAVSTAAGGAGNSLLLGGLTPPTDRAFFVRYRTQERFSMSCFLLKTGGRHAPQSTRVPRHLLARPLAPTAPNARHEGTETGRL